MTPPSLSHKRSVVVGLASQNLVAPIKLLEQNDSRKLVRQCHRPQREPQIWRSKVEALGPADHKAEIKAPLATVFEELTEGDTVEAATVAIEQDDEAALGYPRCYLPLFADLD